MGLVYACILQVELCHKLYDFLRKYKDADNRTVCDFLVRAPSRRLLPHYYEVVSSPIDLMKIQVLSTLHRLLHCTCTLAHCTHAHAVVNGWHPNRAVPILVLGHAWILSGRKGIHLYRQCTHVCCIFILT